MDIKRQNEIEEDKVEVSMLDEMRKDVKVKTGKAIKIKRK